MITPGIGTKIEPTPKRQAEDKPDRTHGNTLQWTLKPNTDALQKEP
jgi:hypothetical protein